jgi:hypothetical protein
MSLAVITIHSHKACWFINFHFFEISTLCEYLSYFLFTPICCTMAYSKEIQYDDWKQDEENHKHFRAFWNIIQLNVCGSWTRRRMKTIYWERARRLCWWWRQKFSAKVGNRYAFFPFGTNNFINMRIFLYFIFFRCFRVIFPFESSRLTSRTLRCIFSPCEFHWLLFAKQISYSRFSCFYIDKLHCNSKSDNWLTRF